jgi:hypothetical protein
MQEVREPFRMNPSSGIDGESEARHEQLVARSRCPPASVDAIRAKLTPGPAAYCLTGCARLCAASMRGLRLPSAIPTWSFQSQPAAVGKVRPGEYWALRPDLKNIYGVILRTYLSPALASAPFPTHDESLDYLICPEGLHQNALRTTGQGRLPSPAHPGCGCCCGTGFRKRWARCLGCSVGHLDVFGAPPPPAIG